MLLQFKETQFQQLFHDIKIYICGVDVSRYLTGSVSVQYADRGGENSISFNLQNAFNNFMLTTDNIVNNKWRQAFLTGQPADWRYSEHAKFLIYKYKTGLYPTSKTPRNIYDSSTGTYRWPLDPERLIFHKHDPVRAFIQDPFKADPNRWVPLFTGFVDTYPCPTDYLNGLSTVEIKCSDLRMIMRKMRVSLNTFNGVQTGVTGNETVVFQTGAGLFNDLLIGNGTTHTFSNHSLEVAVSQLVTGTTDGVTPNTRGIGNYTRGVTQEFESGNDLESWYNLCLFGASEIKKTSSSASVARGYFTLTEVEEYGRACTWDTDGNSKSPFNQQLHMLIPKHGTGASNLTEYSQDKTHGSVDWTSRYDIINDFVSRLDYQFWISPMGDVIVEFPMYDFSPDDFGENVARLLTLDQHIANDRIDDEGGEMYSAVVVSGGLGRREYQNEVNDSRSDFANNTRRIVKSNVLASRIGVVTPAAISLPFFQGADIDSNRLQMWAYLEFNKAQANANQMETSFIYRPMLLPNKPFYHKTKKRIGLISTVNNNIEIFGQPTTSCNMRYIRQQDVKGKFRFITGGESLPISFKHPFKLGQSVAGNGTDIPYAVAQGGAAKS